VPSASVYWICWIRRICGGSQPIRTDRGWFLLYYGVETRETVGVYRTFWALLDLDVPSRILRFEDEKLVLEGNPEPDALPLAPDVSAHTHRLLHRHGGR
jgi:predicted GH43/DUF377 family glycosyl hydrolase